MLVVDWFEFRLFCWLILVAGAVSLVGVTHILVKGRAGVYRELCVPGENRSWCVSFRSPDIRPKGIRTN